MPSLCPGASGLEIEKNFMEYIPKLVKTFGLIQLF